MKIYIYALKHPETKEVRYIGKSINPDVRYKYHLYNAGKFKRHSSLWIKSLLDINLLPEIEIIEECDETNWEEREQYHIKQYDNLTNHTLGGDGRLGDGLITIKSNISRDILFDKITELINQGLSQTEIEYKLELSHGFISRVRGKFIKYTIDNNITLPDSKFINIPVCSGWNKGITNQNRKDKGKLYHYCNTQKKWIVRISVKNKRKILGKFLTEEEAIICRDKYLSTL